MPRTAIHQWRWCLAALAAAGCDVNLSAGEWRPTVKRSSSITVVSKDRTEGSKSDRPLTLKPLPEVISDEDHEAEPEFDTYEEFDPIELMSGERPEVVESAKPVPPADEDFPAVEDKSDPSKSSSTIEPHGDSVPLEGEPATPPFQHLWGENSFDWVFRDGADRLGFFSMKSASSRDLEFFNDPSKFDVNFRYGLHFLSGPEQPDMPPRLYDLYWNVRWLKQLGSGFGFDANFDLGLYTDFEDSVRQGWRFPGRALGFWNLSGDEGPSELTLTAGIEYFDMDNIGVLPAGGVIWQPDEDTRFELYFPRPQVKLRIADDEKDDVWLYLRGDLIGSAWAMERTTGNADVANLLERRVSLGFETRSKEKDGGTSFIEIGYLFHRELDYRSGVGSRDLGDTLTFRLGGRY